MASKNTKKKISRFNTAVFTLSRLGPPATDGAHHSHSPLITVHSYVFLRLSVTLHPAPHSVEGRSVAAICLRCLSWFFLLFRLLLPYESSYLPLVTPGHPRSFPKASTLHAVLPFSQSAETFQLWHSQFKESITDTHKDSQLQ